ncbi:MAG: beta-hydroxyacyl-ACP dehydratase, partial [Planctomycetota bacterium]
TMAKPPLISPADYPLDRVFLDPEGFGGFNPQRFEFQQLTNVLHYDREANLIVASRVLAEDEWWCRGHIPGRPLYPGVLQVEAMAQASCVHAHLQSGLGPEVFLGFAGIEGARFRRTIGPGEKLWIAGNLTRSDPRRGAFRWEGQMIKEDGKVAAEATILGVAI